MSQSTNSSNKVYQKPWFIILCIVMILGAIFGDKKSSSTSSSSSYSSSGQRTCGWCGKSFERGTGYNTLVRQISTPETDYSHYCSRKCATDFLANN